METEKAVRNGRDDINTFERLRRSERTTDRAIKEYNDAKFYKDVVKGYEGNHLREREPR